MVYVIVVYDVDVSRVSKVNRFLKMYLNWVQNSVFEGDISMGQLKEIEFGIDEIIDKNEDSVLIYVFRTREMVKKKHIGVKKSEPTTII